MRHPPSRIRAIPAVCSARAPALADLGADRQAQLRREESLQGDSYDHRGDAHAREADAESDGQLVQADADPERDQRQPLTAGEAAGPVSSSLSACGLPSQL
jgi:hypothetical protein